MTQPNQSELRQVAILFANRIGSPWGEGATYDRSRTEPEDPEEIDEDDRKPNGMLYSHLSDSDFDLFVADFMDYITANYTPNSEVAERERAARVKELERIIRGYHSVDHLMDEQELKERIAELTKAKDQPDER